MYKVKTTKSNVLIKKEHFPEIIRRLKAYFHDDEELQSTRSIHLLIRKFGWKPLVNLKTHDIYSLKLFGDEWPREAKSALMVLCKYIEPGGVIHVIDNNKNQGWSYKFDGKWFEKTALTQLFVDLDCEDEVTAFLDRAIEAAIKMGKTREEIMQAVKKQMVSEYFD